jgi:hypothetical protein
MKYFLFLVFVVGFTGGIYAQPVPAGDENIPYLMTFGPKASTSWGDDDFSQTFFFLKNFSQPVYIRFDPEIGE